MNFLFSPMTVVPGLPVPSALRAAACTPPKSTRRTWPPALPPSRTMFSGLMSLHSSSGYLLPYQSTMPARLTHRLVPKLCNVIQACCRLPSILGGPLIYLREAEGSIDKPAVRRQQASDMQSAGLHPGLQLLPSQRRQWRASRGSVSVSGRHAQAGPMDDIRMQHLCEQQMGA